MRKAALFIGGGLCLVLIATVVRGKEEPGSRQTFGQRVNSLFGLIDRGQNAPPPPPPPDMPAYGRQRTPHMTVPSNNGAANNNGANRSMPTGPNPGAAASRMAGSPLPPAPQRDDGFATAEDVPLEETPPNLNPPSARPTMGMLEQSRKPLGGGAMFTNRAPRSGAPTAGAGNIPTATAKAGAATNGYRSNVATGMPNGNAPPKTLSTQGSLGSTSTTAPRSTGGPPALPPAIISSRRRPPATDDGAASEPAPSPTETPKLSAAPSSGDAGPTVDSTTTTVTPPAPTAVRNEPYVPATPFTADSRSTRPYESVPTASGTNSKNGETPRPIASARRTTSSATAEPGPSSQIPIAGTPAFEVPMNADRSPLSARATNIPSTGGPANRAAVLTAFNSPEVTVETVGPQRISIGREATYRIVVRNRGESEAQQVVVSLGVPPWAEITELHGTAGHATSAEEHAAGSPLEWRLDVLPARAEEEFTLVLVPRRSETFDLQVRWTCSPAAAAAAIEVEEPKLQMSISGPSEVSYGEQRLYKLTVVNPGTGTAENVQLHLMPLNPGDGDVITHKIGDLAAGQDMSIEVELTARQAGRLQIRTEATAAGDLKSSASTEVVVHRPALDVAVTAPKLLFAGVPGTYEVRVRNTGDDAARNVQLSVDLPSGAKLLNSVPAPHGEMKSGELTWTIDRLPAGAEQVYVLKCSLGQGGRQQLTASASADGDLRKTAQAATEVQAVADLALDVLDTPGPVAVGHPVTYEIRVKNRGMKSAEGVDVVAFFSEGIEPEKAEGNAHDLLPGMVVFKTLTALGAGQERVFKVTARATTNGNHRLRVELHSAAPQTDVSHEDSTFFYADENASTTSTSGGAGSNRTVTTSGGPVTPAPFTPDSSSPIGMTSSRVSPPAVGAASTVGDRYNSASTPPVGAAFTPIALPPEAGSGGASPVSAQGAANAPATVYPAALPPRTPSNGLR